MSRNEDRSKEWEAQWAWRLPADRPWIVRLDGRGFHRWTKGLDAPFDDDLRESMVEMTRQVMGDAGAEHAYTQSDEATLVMSTRARSEEAFGGKLQKIVSLLASRASVAFNQEMRRRRPEHMLRAGEATFDARVFAVPDDEGARIALEDRRRDCRRNAVQSVGHWRYGHKWMLRRSIGEVSEQLTADGIGMDTWPRHHRDGVALARIRTLRRFTAEELDRLPGKHAARKDPQLEVERTETTRIDGPDYRDEEHVRAMVFEWREHLIEPGAGGDPG